VAISTSTPERSAFICGLIPTPPNTTAVLSGKNSLNDFTFSSTCAASSRVGVKISARTQLDAAGLPSNKRCSKGKEKPAATGEAKGRRGGKGEGNKKEGKGGDKAGKGGKGGEKGAKKEKADGKGDEKDAKKHDKKADKKAKPGKGGEKGDKGQERKGKGKGGEVNTSYSQLPTLHIF